MPAGYDIRKQALRRLSPQALPTTSHEPPARMAARWNFFGSPAYKAYGKQAEIFLKPASPPHRQRRFFSGTRTADR
ncbi:hypothetical protein HMPREF9413_3975 [Paenibacillus sp. HGF7]|nr:hypothetical protein HMPREF9413_3975 [Paenibacillus sp. HGF7]